MAKKPKKAKEPKASKASKKASKTSNKKARVPKQSGGVFSLVLFFLILEIGAVEAGLFFYFKGDLLYAMVDLLLGR